MSHPSLTSVLEKVSRIYLAGTIEFYSRVPGDPWQTAHDDLEKELLQHQNKEDYFKLMHRSMITFESAIVELTEKYRPFSRGQKGSPASNGFYNGTHPTEEAAIDAFNVKQSNRERACQCGEKKNIRIERHPVHGVGIFCPKCTPVKTTK